MDHFPAGDFGRGALLGLAAGNHLTILFLVPLLFLNCAGRSPVITGWPVVFRRVAGLLAGLTIYLTLPLRAWLGSPVNWYNPVTAKNFVNLISAQAYESYLFSLPAAEAVLRLRATAGLLLDQFTLAGVFFGLYGLFSRLPRSLLMASSWIFIINGIFAIVYGSYDSNLYLLPAYLAFAVWIAYGFQNLLEGLPHKENKYRQILLFLAILGLLVRAPFYIRTVDAGRDTRAEDFGRRFVRDVPARAIVLASEDRQVFALWYFHYALGQRQDVTVIAEGLLQFDWYLYTLAQTYPGLVIPHLSAVSSLDLVSANPARPVCAIDESGRCR